MAASRTRVGDRLITVRGEQRKDIDPHLLAQVVIAVAHQWQAEDDFIRYLQQHNGDVAAASDLDERRPMMLLHGHAFARFHTHGLLCRLPEALAAAVPDKLVDHMVRMPRRATGEPVWICLGEKAGRPEWERYGLAALRLVEAETGDRPPSPASRQPHHGSTDEQLGSPEHVLEIAGIAGASPPGNRQRGMSQKVVNFNFSDLSGKIVEESELVCLVITQHPELADGPVEIDAAPSELEDIQQVDVVTFEIHAPGQAPQVITADVQSFNKLATGNSMAVVLKEARKSYDNRLGPRRSVGC